MKAESKQINKQIILHKMSQMKRVRRENVELQKAVGEKSARPTKDIILKMVNALALKMRMHFSCSRATPRFSSAFNSARSYFHII